jgi:hypothetical protein
MPSRCSRRHITPIVCRARHGDDAELATPAMPQAGVILGTSVDPMGARCRASPYDAYARRDPAALVLYRIALPRRKTRDDTVKLAH